MGIEARNRTLPNWFARVRERQIALPRFQRFEAWDHSRVTQLFNTILQDLPIGAALVLDIGDKEPFISRTLVGAPTKGERITEHLLDGQQRLTALWRALNNNYEERTFFLYLEKDEETGMPYYVDSIGRWRKEEDTERRPFWANKPDGLWKRHMVPLDLCAPGEDSQQRFKKWAKEAIEDRDERDDVGDVVSAVRQKFGTYNLPFLSLPVSTKPATALDVFVKMNTTAEPLSIYDIVVAQLEAGMGRSLHDLVSNVRVTCPTIADYYPPEDLVLYASALLQGRAPTNATYMSREFGPQLVANWKQLVAGVKRVAGFLEEERVFDAPRLPSDVVVPVLAALWTLAPKGLDAEGRARSILRKYMWRAFFSDRYENSTNSRALVDFNELKPLVIGDKAKIPTIFDDQQHPIPTPELLVSAGWPKAKDRVARAILACALRNGGLDLADGSAVSRGNLATREYHHLFPDAYLQQFKVADEKIYVSLNCALVTWQTNRNISAKKPEKYLAERLDGTEVTEAEVRARLKSHLIPYDELVAGDYDKFLQKRAELVHKAALKLCGVGSSEPDDDQEQESKKREKKSGAAAASKA